MRSMIKMHAVFATLLCGAMLISANPARADGGGGGGDPSPALIQQIDERLHGKSDQEINEILAELRGPGGVRSRGDAVFLSRVRAELKRRKGLRDQAASPATPAPTPPTSPTPPSQTSATPLAPPTDTTPAPTASSGNCTRPGAACADEEARQRQARKAETKRAQAAATDWARQQGFIQ